MTADELFDMSVTLSLAAAKMRRELDAKQPHTTREDWMAWDCLKGAAAHLRSAAVHMSAQEERKASHA